MVIAIKAILAGILFSILAKHFTKEIEPNFMKPFFFVTIACLAGAPLVVLAPCAWAQGVPEPMAPPAKGKPDETLPAGASLLPAEALPAFKLFGANAATRETIKVEGQPFVNALRVRVDTKPKTVYSVQIAATTTAPVEKGDALLATFWARATPSVPPAPPAQAKATLVFEQSVAPHKKATEARIEVGQTWKQFHVPFRAGQAHDAGGAQMNFQLGHDVQCIEIGGVSLASYGKSVALDKLPRTRLAGAPRPAKRVDLSKATPLLGSDTLAHLTLTGDAKNTATREVVAIPDKEFKSAVRVRFEVQPPKADDIGLAVPTTAAFEAGDVLVASFALRGTPLRAPITGRARARFVVEPVATSTPAPKSASATVRPAEGWQKIQAAWTATTSCGPGQAQLRFQLGMAPQQIEIAQVSLVNLGKTANAENVPGLPAKRKGPQTTKRFFAAEHAKPDAPWRAEAEARIEKHRKADLTIVVQNAQGKPVPGATVQVTMKRHAFGFGTAVDAHKLLRTGADNDKYREILATWFNRATLENDLKANRWRTNRDTPQKAVQWLRERNLDVRGHVMVWPSWKWDPAAETFKTDPPALRKHIADHIKDIGGTMKGQLADWDVLNEPHTNHDFMEVLGDDAMVEWFKLARQADPTAKLFVNDFDIVEEDLPHQDAYEKTIRFLLDKGAPIDGIGLQGHWFYRPVAPDRMLEILDRFARFGKPLQITEFDVPERTDKARPEYTRYLLTLLFSHPAVESIVSWGFWEGAHWYPHAAYFNKDWTLRPNGQVFTDLVHKAWWTNAAGASDARGTYQTRGFLGDYEITVTHGGKTKTVKTALARPGRALAVTLD